MLRAALRPSTHRHTFVSDLLSGEAGVRWYEWLLDQWATPADSSPDDPLALLQV